MSLFQKVNKISEWFLLLFLSYLIGDLASQLINKTGLFDGINSLFASANVDIKDLWWFLALIALNGFFFKFAITWIGKISEALLLSIPLFVYVIYNVLAFGIIFNFNSLLIFISTLFVGLTEEYLFRGTLSSRLKVIGANKWTIVIITSLLFGLFHLGNLSTGQTLQATIQQVIYTALYGVFNIAIYLRTGSYIVLAVSHALYNWTVLSPGMMYFPTNVLVHTYAIGLVFALFGIWYLRKVEN